MQCRSPWPGQHGRYVARPNVNSEAGDLMENDTPAESDDAKTNRRSGVIVRLINLFGLVAIAGTVLSLAASQHWIADVVVQFRVQYLMLLVPSVTLWVGKRFFKRAIVGGLALAANLWFVVPYYSPQDSTMTTTPAVPNSNQAALRLLVLNVLRTNEEIQATLEEVVDENADFLFLMEVSHDWNSHLQGLKDRYPHQQLICRDDYTGVAFLSKYPWRDVEIIDTGDANPPLDFIFSSVGDQTAGFRLIATHPLPPFGAELTDSRDRQLNTLAKRCQSSLPTLMVGDFNLTPWSPRFRQVLDVGQLRDASQGYGISPTLTPLPTLMGGLKVDHVLANCRVTIRDFQLNSCLHSDHQRVIVDFHITATVP